MKRARAREIVAACVAGVIGVSCASIIGVGNATFDATGDAASNGDGTVGGDDDGSSPDGASGEGGTRDGGADVETCDADIKTDEHNCGACRHDCQGATCTLGTCDPLKVANVVGRVQALVPSNDGVYWIDLGTGTVRRCPLTGCTNPDAPDDLTDRLTTPTGLGVSTDDVYVTTDEGAVSRLLACPKSGCADGGAVTVTLGSSPKMGIALDPAARLVYWLQQGASSARSCGFDGGCPDGGSLAATALVDSLNGIAASNGAVYWTEPTTVPTYPAGAVRCVAPCDGGKGDLVGASPRGQRIAAGSGGVFWEDCDPSENDAAVLACPLGGCADGGAQVLVSGHEAPQSIATDGVDVFFATTSNTIARCPAAGCPAGGPIDVAKGQNAPRLVAVDATSIYWANADAVMKVVK